MAKVDEQLAAGPGVGAEVLVRWADGGEYPAQIAAIQGRSFLCRFKNGGENWVDAAFVRVTSAGPTVHVPFTPSVQSAGLGAESTPNVHAVVGVAIAVVSVFTNVMFMLKAVLFGDLPLGVLFSEVGLFDIWLLFRWAVEAAIAGSVAALLSGFVRVPSPFTRGAIIGAVAFPVKVFLSAALFALMSGFGNVVYSYEAVIQLVYPPSLMPLVVWAIYAVAGGLTVTSLGKTIAANQPRPAVMANRS